MRKTSLADVAAAAGVSVGTASNVLNDPEKVRPATRNKVVRAMRDLGYMPSLTIPALPDNVFPAADETRPLFVSAGYISVDSIIHIDVMPHRGDRVTAERVFKELGGPATNVAVAAAALGGSCALDVELATAIGQDTDSLWALKLLAERGVRARAIRSPEKGRLSRCVVLVEPGGVRTKINEHLDLSDEDLIAHLTTSRSKRARHIHVDGYQVDRMLPAIRDMRTRGWTASSQDTGLSATYRSAAGFAELSREVDYFVLNRKSVARILGSTLPPDGVVTRFNTYLRDTGATAEVVVTLGLAGAAVFRPGREPVRCSAPQVLVVDGTGAGDCFWGAYLAQRLNRIEPSEAASGACIAASLSMTASGAQSVRPSQRDIKKLRAREEA